MKQQRTTWNNTSYKQHRATRSNRDMNKSEQRKATASNTKQNNMQHEATESNTKINSKTEQTKQQRTTCTKQLTQLTAWSNTEHDTTLEYATWSNTEQSNMKQIIKHRATTHLCRTIQSNTTYQQMSDWWHRLEFSPPGHRLLLVIAFLSWSLWLVLYWE